MTGSKFGSIAVIRAKLSNSQSELTLKSVPLREKIHAVTHRYLTIITPEQELLEIKAGKALSTAVNVTEQAEALLSP